MQWLNIHIAKQLRCPACVGSSPSELGTWLLCLAYCCEQENGGRIAGAAKWKDRQLQRAIGITLAEVRAADRLLTLEGDDILVNGYPDTKVANVQRLRGQSKAAALSRWGKRDGHCHEVVPEGMPNGIPQGIANGNAEEEVEVEGEEEEEGKSAAAPPPAQASQPTPPPGDDDELAAITGAPSGEPAHITRACDRRTFADWRIMVGKRIFWTREEDQTWRAMFDAEGWDEMTKGYEYLAKTIPPPKKIFISMIQELRV
jgi:hypothetical protein